MRVTRKVVSETNGKVEHGGEQKAPPRSVQQALLLIRYLRIEIIEELQLKVTRKVVSENDGHGHHGTTTSGPAGTPHHPISGNRNHRRMVSKSYKKDCQ